MKIVMWSDVHVEHSVAADNQRGVRQSVLVLDVLENIIYSMEEKPDVILVNGDFFDAFGKIESSLAVVVVERIEKLARSGIRIIFITGNHEYPDVEPQYFGRGILTALFAGKEERGIYVVDEFARFIRLDEKHVILGLPYRESYHQFETSCLIPMRDGVARGDFVPGRDKLVVGWHVGLPFATAWRGDEDENAWINADDPAVQEIFSYADGQRIFLGHFHGPGDSEFITKDGRYIGTGTYIGSPATRTRTESGQDKRIGVWQDGQVSFISTGLDIDTVVHSVQEAVDHLASLVDRFGDEILETASVYVELGDNASLDDYHVAKAKANQFSGDISINRPNPTKKGLGDPIIEKHKQDPNSTRAMLETDLFHYSIRLYFKNSDFKNMSDAAIEAMFDIGPKTWKRLWRAIKKGKEDPEAVCLIAEAFSKAGLTEEAMPPLTLDFCAQAVNASLTVDLAKKITLTI